MDQGTSDRLLAWARADPPDWGPAYRSVIDRMVLRAHGIIGRFGQLGGDSADDIAHRAWMRVMATDPSTIVNLQSYALTATRNAALDALRRHKPIRISYLERAESNGGERCRTGGHVGVKVEVLGADLVDSVEDEYFDAAEAAERRELLYQLSGVLSEQELHVFVQVLGHVRTRTDVGQDFEPSISGQRVGQVLVQALGKLRDAQQLFWPREGVRPARQQNGRRPIGDCA